MITSLRRTAAEQISAAQSLLMTTLPHGMQRSARRNAWASMAADNTRARARREADTALAAALVRQERRHAASS